jgi:hypothetical protein
MYYFAMKELFLITAGGSFLAEKLAQNLCLLTETCILTEENPEQSRQEETAGIKRIYYNPASSLAARNAVLELQKNDAVIKEAFILYKASSDVKLFHELSHEDIRSNIEAGSMQTAKLLKELFGLFIKHKNGTVNFIIEKQETAGLSPMNAMNRAAFAAAAETAAESYSQAGFSMRIFEALTQDTEGFADFILKTVKETPVKGGRQRLKYSGKNRLFGF